MATRTPKGNTNLQTRVPSSNTVRDTGDSWTVFNSMKEFWFWVAIVTLIIFGLMGLSFLVTYQSKQLKKAEALIQRLEEKEKKRNEKPRIDPVE